MKKWEDTRKTALLIIGLEKQLEEAGRRTTIEYKYYQKYWKR